MKKGIIVEIKNDQKVILADNGRFYISALKKGDVTGKRVRIGLNKQRAAALAVGVFIATFSFIAGMQVVTYTTSGTPDTLVRISSFPDDYSAEFILNQQGKVLSVAPLSAAAVVVLSGLNYENKSIETVAKEYIDESLKCGYINIDTAGLVIVNSYSASENRNEDIKKRTNKSIRTFAYEKGVRVLAVSGLNNFSTQQSGESSKNLQLPVTTAASILVESSDIRENVLKQIDEISYETAIEYVSRLKSSEVMRIIRLAHEEFFRKIDMQQREIIGEIRQYQMIKQKKILESQSAFITKEQYDVWETLKQKEVTSQIYKYQANTLIPPPYVGGGLQIALND